MLAAQIQNLNSVGPVPPPVPTPVGPIVINYGPALGGAPSGEPDPRFDTPSIVAVVSTAPVGAVLSTAPIEAKVTTARVTASVTALPVDDSEEK